ncbi:MAG: manganese/zinc/iron transport system substrate-binding protein [Lentimonas sp.]|jgi:manganese/zinc/iron transport system substrate-binding protein
MKGKEALKMSGFGSVVIGLLFLFSCQYSPKQSQQKRLVLCTTGMIGDGLKNILPKEFEIHTLMGPGVDPHMFEARPHDIKELAKAETIVYNGLHLEGKIAQLFKKLKKEKEVLAVSDYLNPDKYIEANDYSHDPHIWLDPFLWAEGIKGIGYKLAKLYPDFSDVIIANTEAYYAQILSAGNEMKRQLNQIPESQRVLITSHDAFSYFGRAFDIRVDALQGISTVSEPGIRTVSSLMNDIVKNKIPCVFVESSVAKKSILALREACERKGYDLKEGGTLYSDAMGPKGSGADTYLKMLGKNAETISKGLKQD